MGCGASSLTGDSFDGINANKVRKVNVHGIPSASEYKHDSIYSSSRPSASSDPTKGPYLQTQREEPLRDKPLPTTSKGHYRKPSYHDKGVYRDLTMSSDDDPSGATASGAANMVKDKKGRWVRAQSWSERSHGGPEPRDPATGRGLYTNME